MDIQKGHLYTGRYSSGRREWSPKPSAKAHSGSNPDRSALIGKNFIRHGMDCL